MTNKKSHVILIATLLVAGLALPAAQPPTEAELRIARQVQRQIATLSNYGVFDSITFNVDGTKVTLNGYASRPTLKKSAERVVAKIEGVASVENTIKVLPLSRHDDDVRARVYASIYGHPSLSRYSPNRGMPAWTSPTRIAAGITNDPPLGRHPIHIIVERGNVTLEGVIDSAGDRQIAGIQANSAVGAFSVTNNIVVPNAANAD
jgi:osmotically-inducible protein OsmY